MSTNSLELLAQTLRATADEDHLQRHDLTEVRQQGSAAIELARVIEAGVGDVPESLSRAAHLLDELVRNTPAKMEDIRDALAGFRREVATFIVLDGSADQLTGLDFRSVANAASEAQLTAETAAGEIERLLGSSQRLVSRAADDELAKHYRESADDEATAADTWRRRTICGFVGTLALGATTAAISIFAQRSLEEVVGAGSFSLAVGGLTTFLATQAKLHRGRETTFRNAELKLAVVAPMLDAMSSDVRDNLQMEVVKLLFETERPLT